MAYTRQELLDRVSQRIDEVVATGDSVIQGITEGSVDLIDDELDESARMVLTNAPLALVYPAASNDAAATVAISNLVMTITCPTTFLRFVRAKVSGITMPITELYPITHPMYRRVHNKSNAGHYQKPLAFLVPGTTGSKYRIEVFRTATGSDTLTEFIFVPETVAENVPTALQDALIDHTAYRVLAALRDAASAKIAYEAYQLGLQSVKKGLVGE